MDIMVKCLLCTFAPAEESRFVLIGWVVYIYAQ